MHRAPQPAWRRILVGALIALVVGGGIAYALVIVLWHHSGGTGLPPVGPQATPTVTQTHIIAPSLTPEPTASAEETVEPSPTPTAPALDLATDVSVLNGSGISGLAARQQQALEGVGFTTVSAGNLTSSKPAANTVRYATEDQVTTAQRVAEVLGITAVEMGTTSNGGIEVLLVTDPAA